MVTKTADLIATKTGIKHIVIWEEEEGYTEKVLNSILDELGEEEGESREAAYAFMLKELEDSPTMIFDDPSQLSVNAALFLEGYAACLARQPLKL